VPHEIRLPDQSLTILNRSRSAPPRKRRDRPDGVTAWARLIDCVSLTVIGPLLDRLSG